MVGLVFTAIAEKNARIATVHGVVGLGLAAMVLFLLVSGFINRKWQALVGWSTDNTRDVYVYTYVHVYAYRCTCIYIYMSIHTHIYRCT